jgi:hypothetical protein
LDASALREARGALREKEETAKGIVERRGGRLGGGGERERKKR